MASFEQVRRRPQSELSYPRELVVACVPMRSNVNISAIARTASACGVQKLVLCGNNKLISKIARDGADELEIVVRRTLLPALKKFKVLGEKELAKLGEGPKKEEYLKLLVLHEARLAATATLENVGPQLLRVCTHFGVDPEALSAEAEVDGSVPTLQENGPLQAVFDRAHRELMTAFGLLTPLPALEAAATLVVNAPRLPLMTAPTTAPTMTTNSAIQADTHATRRPEVSVANPQQQQQRPAVHVSFFFFLCGGPPVV